MLYSYGITKYRGTADYQPEQYMLRQEAARFMTEFAKNVLCRKKVKTYANNFTDISWIDPTLRPFIIESYDYGIFKWDGPERYTTFRPKDVISKNELTAIMMRLIMNEFQTEVKWDWSKLYRQELTKYSNGIVFDSVKRENVAEVIYSLYKNNKFELQDVWYVVVRK